jgi:uncharacterized membrane protein
MTNYLRTTAKSSGRHRVVAALLGVLAVFGMAAVVYAAAGKPDFSLSPSPTTQTTLVGQSTTYAVTVSRVNGYKGTVDLSTSGIPAGATALWNNGQTTVKVAPTSTTATLTVQTTSSIQPGTYALNITGIDDTTRTLAHTISVTLVVPKPDFSLSASPSSRTVTAGSSATYTVTIVWLNGLTSPVTFSSPELPRGMTATFVPSSIQSPTTTSTLTIATSSSTDQGSHQITIRGISGSVAHTVGVTLIVQKSGFTLSGSLATPLTLGGSGEPLNLQITNPFSTPLTVFNLNVTLISVTQAAGAKGTCNQQTGTPNSPNFQVNNLPASYSVTVPAKSTVKLSQLGSGQLPTVTWIDQAGWAQNGCLGAGLTFSYTGSATS